MPSPELAPSVLVDVDGAVLEVINTHVPNEWANGWRKVEDLEALYGSH